jgi:hypothetical protein
MPKVLVQQFAVSEDEDSFIEEEERELEVTDDELVLLESGESLVVYLPPYDGYFALAAEHQ